MTIKSIEDESGMNCVDLSSNPDGTYTFKVFRKDPEDQGRWTLVGDYSGLRFDTEAQVLAAAAARIPWLAASFPATPAAQRRGMGE
jgi:hypothetical protein